MIAPWQIRAFRGLAMAYDDRLIIKRDVPNDKGKELVNTLKMIEQHDYIQLYVRNGSSSDHRYGQMRLDKDAVQQIIDFLVLAQKSLK